MRIKYDPAADAAYVYLVDRIQPGEAKTQIVVLDGGVVLDLDAEGRLLGVEVVHAKRLLRPETLHTGKKK